MTVGSNVLIFTYGINGPPASVKYNGTDYYYVTNAQGDVVSILNSSGTAVVTYNYDAWGNLLSTTGTMASTLGAHNPLRYRGYVYDEETGLYYLQSRYYNPTICRFISADSVIAGVGGNAIGYNVFAYCFNNPVNMTDQAGSWPSWNDIKTGFAAIGNWVNNSIIAPIVGFGADIAEDYRNYNPENEDPNVAFSANYFSNYNGAFVILTDFDASFSFGIIGLSRMKDADSLKHEYGHWLQLENRGWLSYITGVCIPSATINLLARLNKLPYDYYSYPFEAEANNLGGSTAKDYRGYPALPTGGYTSYWDLILLFFK